MAEPGDGTMSLIAALVRGENGAWARFVERHGRLVRFAVRPFAGAGQSEEDLVQDVFTRLLRDDARLLRSYDPARAGLSTWLTIVARSTARDATRRLRAETITLDDAPEAALAVDPPPPRERLVWPPDLLSPRQREILSLLYEQELDVAEAASRLGLEAQTIRSLHHKAMVKLRAHFGVAPKA